MFKLLLADDEKWIRQGLMEIIDWKSCGIGELREAADGGEALAEIREFHPDIVITDVRMPDIDGLELCARLKEEFPEIKVIIISGYQDFNYARKALSLGVFDYILKPLEEENVSDTVRKCLAAIVKERAQQKELELIKTNLQANSSLILQEYLGRVLKEGAADPCLILNRFQELGLNMDALCYHVFLVAIDGLAFLKKNLTFKELEEIKLKLIFKTREWIGRIGKGTVFCGEDHLTYGALGLESNFDQADLEAEFRALGQDLIEGCGFTVTICVSDPAEDLGSLPELRAQVEQCLNRRFFLGGGKVILYQPSFELTLPYRYDTKREESVLEALRVGNESDLLKSLQEIKNEIENNQQGLTEADVKLIYEGLLEYVCRKISEEIPLMSPELAEDKIRVFRNLKYLDSMAAVAQCVEEQLCLWLSRLADLKGSGKRKIIQSVIDYVASFYNQKITLATAAEYIHFNPSYLSKLFCAEMGEPFTRYLMKVRVEKAKEILKNPVPRIYEVGERVGYSDIKYFTKVFKELEGMTPAEYRERCLPPKTKIME